MAGEGKSMDMFTREGNIPRTNRNEKPTAATKQPPAASPRGRCMYTREARKREKQWKGRSAGGRRCTERERKAEGGGNHGGEDRTGPEARRVGGRLKSLLSLLIKFCFHTTASFRVATPRATSATNQFRCIESGYKPELS